MCWGNTVILLCGVRLALSRKLPWCLCGVSWSSMKGKVKLWWGSILIAVLLCLALNCSPVASKAVSDYHSFFRFESMGKVSHPLYAATCGDCHFLVPPGLLPSRSWRLLLAPAQLNSHFGTIVRLKEDGRRSILDYLLDNSAENSENKFSREIYSSLPSHSTPVRISEIPYIRDRHQQFAIRVDSNVSMSCDRCHLKTTADHCRRCHKGFDDMDSGRYHALEGEFKTLDCLRCHQFK